MEAVKESWAYAAGRAACEHGRPLLDNPYRKNSQAWEDWLAGWVEFYDLTPEPQPLRTEPPHHSWRFRDPDYCQSQAA